MTLIAGGAGGFAVYSFTTPLYQSSVQLIVTGASDARLLASQRASALSDIAGTPPAIKDAEAAAGFPNATPRVSSTASGRDPFLTITVVDPNAGIAQAVANAYSQSLSVTGGRLDGSAPTGLGLATVSAAGLPAKPFSPNPLRDIGLGLAAGFVLGIAIALVRDTLNRTVRDSAELEKLTGLTGLGTVPRDAHKVMMPITTDPRGPRAEAYRQIRTSVVNSSNKRPLIIAVTSAVPGEGKTSVTTNVAAAFSRAGHRVAIIDADLRRPRVGDYFGLKAPLGLTDVLAGECALEDALTMLDEDRLAVLTAGGIPANPSEALGGVVMEQILHQLTADRDYVFIDTPPVLPVTDALVLAPKVDAVMLVCRLGHTTREVVKQAMASIARVNAQILGVVPNQAGRGLDSDYGYRYRYAYGPKGGGKSPTTVDIAVAALQTSNGHAPQSHGAPDAQASSSNGHAHRLPAVDPVPVDPVPVDPVAADPVAADAVAGEPVAAAVASQNGHVKLDEPDAFSQTSPSPSGRE